MTKGARSNGGPSGRGSAFAASVAVSYLAAFAAISSCAFASASYSFASAS